MTTNDHEAGKVSDADLEHLIAHAEMVGNQGTPSLTTGEAAAMARELSTRRAESQTGAVRVKALEWKKAGPVFWEAVTYYGTYGIERQSDTIGHTFWCWFKPGGYSAAETISGYNSTLAVAKASAQEKHDSVTLSALEPTPIKETASPADGLAVDDLAQEIRRVDGDNSLGAGQLAEALMPFLAGIPAVPADVQGVTDAIGHAQNEWADGLTNAIQWLRNVRDGVSTVETALANVEPEYDRVLAVSRAALSDYQRLAAENERLRAMLFPYAGGPEIAGISWGGFYLIGDSKSIGEFRRIEHRAAQLEQFRQAYDESVARERTGREAAEGKLAEAAERACAAVEEAGALTYPEEIILVQQAIRKALTSPLTEQGGM